MTVRTALTVMFGPIDLVAVWRRQPASAGITSRSDERDGLPDETPARLIHNDKT